MTSVLRHVRQDDGLQREREPRTADDLDAHISSLAAAEQEELKTAEIAVDLAMLLHRIRAHRGLSQSAAAERAGLHQQAVSRLERPHGNVRLDRLSNYITALGYTVELKVIDPATGEATACLVVSPNE